MGLKKGIFLLGFAIIAIGIFVLPSTMSMFVGQHSWYSVRTDAQRDTLCERCHLAEYQEFASNTGAHSSFVNEDGSGTGCVMCHTVNTTALINWGINTTSINGSIYLYNVSGTLDADNYTSAWRNNSGAHAAITVDCVDCHWNASQQLLNDNEAHTAFYESTIDGSDPFTANGSSEINNPSAACIACHTHTSINVTFIRATGMNITANHTSGTWDMDVFQVNSSEYNTTSSYNSTY
ncbi:MAG: hypothetical protein MIO93_09850 [ANME-2 cluster archaeon]|nr:hypothetical protein [ANME-2 cluster archaeon]